MDKYQKRYLLHQKIKKNEILNNIKDRRSCRVFDPEKHIDNKLMNEIKKISVHSPTSCNRNGIKIKTIFDRGDKELLSGILVGGIGWIHRADKVLLIFADKLAYKSPYEKEVMPYIDTGCLVQTLWLATESLGIGMGYVNPNINDINKGIFNERFGEDNCTFCGAVALGFCSKNPSIIERINPKEIWI